MTIATEYAQSYSPGLSFAAERVTGNAWCLEAAIRSGQLADAAEAIALLQLQLGALARDVAEARRL